MIKDLKKYATDLEWCGQIIYLPEYTKLFRKVESEMTKYLVGYGFEECLFPKLLTFDQYLELKKSLPRFSKEWSKEVISASNGSNTNKFPKKYTLSHWQCEPFYFYLKQIKPYQTIKYFDKSGWTYRVEKDVSDYRLFEFQRIECVWFSDDDNATKILLDIVDILENAISNLGLKTKVLTKTEEERESEELMVKDIEVFNGNSWIEVVGAHLHGTLFVKSLEISKNKNVYTGCCGIGTSRLTNILIGMNNTKRDA